MFVIKWKAIPVIELTRKKESDEAFIVSILVKDTVEVISRHLIISCLLINS